MKGVTEVSNVTEDLLMDFDMGKRKVRDAAELEQLISSVLLKCKSGWKCGGCLYGWFRPTSKEMTRKHIESSHATLKEENK